MIYVFHNPKTNFFKGILEDVFSITIDELVASVSTNDLEEAFKLTNSIDRAWYDNPDVIVERPSRSTSVGDFMVTDDGKWYMVDGVGFLRIPAIFNKEIRVSHHFLGSYIKKGVSC